MEKNLFPQVSGKNLERKKFVFPDDFPSKYTIVLMAFYRHQQMDIDTWLPFVESLESKYQDTAYIELPVIYQMGPVRQFMLNEGMRAGIPDQKAREKTITLYLDKSKFLTELGIVSEKDIQILLVEGGKIIWREKGRFSKEKGEALNYAMKQAGIPLSDRITVNLSS